MKKIILTILLALFELTLAAQQITSYDCYGISYGQRNELRAITWGRWRETNTLLTIDWNNDFIRLYSADDFNGGFKIIRAKTVKEINTIIVKCTAADSYNQLCELQIILTEDKKEFYVFYDSVAVGYIFRLIE